MEAEDGKPLSLNASMETHNQYLRVNLSVELSKAKPDILGLLCIKVGIRVGFRKLGTNPQN